MKKFFFLAFFLILFSGFATAQWGYKYNGKVKTGKTPLRIYLTNVGFVLYCAGFDANFNGIKDDGDEPPSLWQIGLNKDDDIVSKKIIDLEFRTPLMPSRSYFDLQRNLFFAINKNSIDTVSLFFNGTEPAAKKGRYISNISNVSSISGSFTKLFISVRKSLTEGYVYVYDITNKKFVDTIKAGKGVQMNKYMPFTGQLFVLNEGTFGKDDGSLQWNKYQGNKHGKITTVNIGGLPNHFMYDVHFHKIYVTCNTSNNVIRIDANNKTDTIHFDLPQYNGPRETTVFPIEGSSDPLFAVTTYDSKVFIINNNKKVLHTFEAYGKAESLFYISDNFLIITPFEKGSYKASSEITIYSKKASDVADAHLNKWLISPNPVVDDFSLSYPDNVKIRSLELYNTVGKKVASFDNHQSGTLRLGINLPTGMYFLKIAHNRGIKTIPLLIK